MNNELYPLMVAGTGSDVGKSVLTAGLGRLFLEEGWRPAPFKAQNMALNSYPGLGGEMGRAQVEQAWACGLEPRVEMNPVLIKPEGETRAQVVVMGRPLRSLEASAYFRRAWTDRLARLAHAAYLRLARSCQPMLLEGAGSLGEINLWDRDFVNLPMARRVEARILLVGDIERGGIFASLLGTLDLLPPADRERVAGLVVNRFRGDIGLFEEGRRMLEERAGVPVLGVIPWLPDLELGAEDALLRRHWSAADGRGPVCRVGVVLLRRLSNANDFETLARQPGVDLRYLARPEEAHDRDLLILPGSKHTLGDLARLRRTGWSQVLRRWAQAGRPLLGICGGMQMLGLRISDPEGVEGGGTVPGLGLLPLHTTFGRHKRVCRAQVRWLGTDDPWEPAYEIHQGRTVWTGEPGREGAFLEVAQRGPEGYAQGGVLGTYLHDALRGPSLQQRFLERLLPRERVPALCRTTWEAGLTQWVNHLRAHLDFSRLLEGLRRSVPRR